MRIVKVALLLSTILISTSCSSKNNTKKETSTEVKVETKTIIQDLSSYETAYFASGCFWCVEAVFESVKGVKEVISGYAGGTEKNPTYEQVGSGNSTHAEAVVVYYNPKEVSYATLVKVFFGSQDPTTLNRQGPDKGTQYRSIAFYKNKQEQKIITDYIAKLTKEKVFSSKIVTEVTPFTTFYKAEDYHQDYEKKHPNNPYIKNVSVPRLNRFKNKFPELLKKNTH
ncbi:peptide-methionine (S)-S-oxide reductase MsrA [Cellulophaga omnivescoria]|uniref:peptide-methionine (S)-S-oxide reductase MsrA n=1 Tax=Cellulophaga omnivescoria TaxID=1888890 RepID=UPI000985CDC6|nr:peptide-methionine (S)-S-oxide reductase MsrA [Cellulophaga omnivescoria]WBU89466.1 peptide-methionine (S)-S-oxide reductase MsrA [Cellulophaga omnivescoria]WKB81489.1 peptide-methionine (S)-S-oxide reductase MsrA [Cellulophaga lytica]